MMMRSVLSALLLVFLVTRHTGAYQGSKKPLCASCGIKNTSIPTVQDEYGFTEFLFDQPITGSTPIDLSEDGVWELAVMLGSTGSQGTESSQKVGILDLRTLSWADGPHSLPVTNSKWGAAEVGTSGSLHYYYLLGQAIRDFSASDQVDSVLLNLDYVPTSIIAWGREDGWPLIGARKGGTGNTTCQFPHSTWYIYRAMSGELVVTVPGATGAISRLRPTPGADDKLGFLVSAGSFSDPPGPIFFSEFCAWADSYSDGWIREDRRLVQSIYGAVSGTWLTLVSATSCWREDGSGANVWYATPGGFTFGQTSYYLFATDGSNWSIPFVGYSGQHTSVAALDIDSDGNDELLMPLTNASSGNVADWEVRTSTSGQVIDTLQNMPSAYLASGPYLKSNRNALFYTKGSSLFLISDDFIITSVDDPHDENSTVSPLTLSAIPNPFNSAVMLSWTGAGPDAAIALYNILGQTIRTFDDAALSGNSTITWDGLDSRGRSVTSGVYFARLVASGRVATTKLVLLR